jgi:hypothetical protein
MRQTKLLNWVTDKLVPNTHANTHKVTKQGRDAMLRGNAVKMMGML